MPYIANTQDLVNTVWHNLYAYRDKSVHDLPCQTKLTLKKKKCSLHTLAPDVG